MMVAGYLFPIHQDCDQNIEHNNMLCLLLKIQFTFFILPLPLPGYCMQIKKLFGMCPASLTATGISIQAKVL